MRTIRRARFPIRISRVERKARPAPQKGDPQWHVTTDLVTLIVDEDPGLFPGPATLTIEQSPEDKQT